MRLGSAMQIHTASFDFSPERVKRIRISFGETQQAFAKRLGVDVNMVSRWETGVAEPRSGRVIKALLDAEAEANGA